MRVTIIGAGNAGFVHTAKLIEKGVDVCICKNSSTVHNAFFNKVELDGGFKAIDATNSDKTFFAKPKVITRDIKEAIEFADVVMVMTTTLQHDEIAMKIAPFAKEGMIIALIPGYMGSLIFKKHIKKQVIFSEWETTAYNGRIVDDEMVRITFYNPRNAISSLPQIECDRVIQVFNKLFCNTKYARKHILESAFHNPNMIVHTIGVLFSTARIEFSNGDFWMYKEAFTPSVINVIKAFDKQKNMILELFGCPTLDYFDAAKWRNSEDLSIDSMDVFKSFANASNKGPSSIQSRYFTEDVPNGLCLFSSVGKTIGVDTSIADSIISLASSLLNVDLWRSSRTIDQLLDSEVIDKSSIDKAIL